jgi:hypothetical protein
MCLFGLCQWLKFLIFHLSNLHSILTNERQDYYAGNNKHFRVTMSSHYAGCLDFQQDTIIQPLMV